MPLRNFWATVRVDGRATTLCSGPRGKTGGMQIFLAARDHGESHHVLTVTCTGQEDGQLCVTVGVDGHPDIVKTYER